jgi:hypothetical protein
VKIARTDRSDGMQLPEFGATIRKMAEGRDPEGLREILMFGCPVCGHITPDHRWSEPFNCLIDGCKCTGIPDEVNDLDTTVAIIQALAGK